MAIIFEATEISGLSEPTYPSAAANKKYIDAISSNILTNIALSGAKDLQTWNSTAWHNSSLGWDNNSQTWKPYKSGAGSSTDVAWSGASTFYASAAKAIYSSNSVDILVDVDTTSDPPERNEVLKWNGSKWVCAAYDYDFTFTFDSFSGNITSPALIGAGEWLGIGSATFTCTYTNGPPSSMIVYIDGDFDTAGDSGWTNDMLTFTASDKLSQATTEATNYPDDAGDTITFKGSANSESPRTTTVQFKNQVRWGESDTETLDSDDVNGLNNSDLSENENQTFDDINPGAGESAILAFPTRIGRLNASTDLRYKRQGTDNAAMTASFTEQSLNSHENSAGYSENYYVYKSDIASLGDGEILANDGQAAINQLKYGSAPSANIGTGLFTPGFITNLTGADVDNDTTQDPDTSGWNFNPGSTPGSREYIFLAVPSRFSLSATGFSYQSGSAEMIIKMTEISSNMAWANPCGYEENYDIWRSDISGEALTDSNSSCQLGIGQTLVNRIYYGTSTKADTYTSADVIGLSNSSITNQEQTSYSINPGASDYVVVAWPTRCGQAATSLDYEDDSTNSFKFNSIGCGMNEETVSVTNAYGYAENYYVYISNITNMDGTSLSVGGTTNGVINYMFFGSDTATTINESQIEDMDTKHTGDTFTDGKLVSNTTTREMTFDATAGEFVWFCYPKRLGTVDIYTGPDHGGFEDPITVSVTNSSGWTEDYYCYRSNYAGNVEKTYSFTAE